MENKSSTSSRSPGDVQGDPVAKKSRLVLKTIIYDESIPNQWLDEPPLEIWDHHIIPLLGLRDLALSRPVCTFFEAYWQDKFSNNVLPLRVGNDVATIHDVMAVVEILSRRREYTKLNPFIVLLGKGVHEITSSYEDPYNIQGKLQTSHDDPYHSFAEVRITRPCTLRITCNSISFLGQGNEETIIKGGFAIEEQQNIMFKQMTVTNPSGAVIDSDDITAGMIINDAEVELNDVVVQHCEDYALRIRSTNNSTLVARRCEFKECRGGLASFPENTISHFYDCTFHSHKVFGLYVEAYSSKVSGGVRTPLKTMLQQRQLKITVVLLFTGTVPVLESIASCRVHLFLWFFIGFPVYSATSEAPFNISPEESRGVHVVLPDFLFS